MARLHVPTVPPGALGRRRRRQRPGVGVRGWAGAVVAGHSGARRGCRAH